MLEELFPENEHPLLVTVMLGTNDAALVDVEPAAHMPLDEYESNLDAIVKHVKSNATQVIVMTPPCMDESQRLKFQNEKYGKNAIGKLDRTNENTRRYAEVCKKVARRHSVPCLDLFASTLRKQNENGKPSLSRTQSLDPWAEPAGIGTPKFDREKLLFIDGIHFSESGQKLVAKALMDCINSDIPGDVLKSDSMDPDWPFGPQLRGNPQAWREKMEHHSQTARIDPTLFGKVNGKDSVGTETKNVIHRAPDTGVPGTLTDSTTRGIAVLLTVAGIGAGLGYLVGARR